MKRLWTRVSKTLAQCAVTPNVSGMIPLAVLQDAPEALRGRLVLAVLAAVAGHEKDLTAAHIRAVLTLDRGQLSMPYGVTVLRESAALRFFKAASAPGGAGCFRGRDRHIRSVAG